MDLAAVPRAAEHITGPPAEFIKAKLDYMELREAAAVTFTAKEQQYINKARSNLDLQISRSAFPFALIKTAQLARRGPGHASWFRGSTSRF